MKINAKHLKIILLLTSLHTLCIGIALIVLPDNLMSLFGFTELGGRFFRTQGGVFHLVMALGYYFAAIDIPNCRNFIKFIIIVKFTATVFLVIYYLFIDPTIVILLSGVIDFLIGLTIFYLNYQLISNEIESSSL
ncbi:MAG: hypothetical protein KIT33_08470 [Candidatus Kapabacteria bacterium]|nr:hypothetical protein [Ignavibacteriota bacterium]MCW5884989.1 hypothetical protein [Candidatus Kapabacteria bacterium]